MRRGCGFSVTTAFFMEVPLSFCVFYFCALNNFSFIMLHYQKDVGFS